MFSDIEIAQKNEMAPIADVAKKLYPELKKDDVVIGLGAGTITNLSKELMNARSEAVGATN